MDVKWRLSRPSCQKDLCHQKAAAETATGAAAIELRRKQNRPHDLLVSEHASETEVWRKERRATVVRHREPVAAAASVRAYNEQPPMQHEEANVKGGAGYNGGQ